MFLLCLYRILLQYEVSNVCSNEHAILAAVGRIRRWEITDYDLMEMMEKIFVSNRGGGILGDDGINSP